MWEQIEVLVNETKLIKGQGRLSLDVSDWSEGTYWYYLPETARAIATGTFVIHR